MFYSFGGGGGGGGGGGVVPVANQFSRSKTNCVDVLRTIPWMHQVRPSTIGIGDLDKISKIRYIAQTFSKLIKDPRLVYGKPRQFGF
jgi:hypothetical protein